MKPVLSVATAAVAALFGVLGVQWFMGAHAQAQKPPATPGVAQPTPGIAIGTFLNTTVIVEAPPGVPSPPTKSAVTAIMLRKWGTSYTVVVSGQSTGCAFSFDQVQLLQANTLYDTLLSGKVREISCKPKTIQDSRDRFAPSLNAYVVELNDSQVTWSLMTR